MTRILSIICLTAILSAIGQNRGDIWVMADADCPISPTAHPLRCAESVQICDEQVEPVETEPGCCSKGCASEQTEPERGCGKSNPGTLSRVACPKPDEEKKCCKLIHPLWADIPHKAVAPTPNLEPLAVFNAEITFDIGRAAEIDQTVRPWGIHPSIASTVLRI